jgi:anaerobic selenocysteine-containing dehydrogenase
MPVSYLPPAETADAEYPLVLMTGRSTFHYHSTLTRKVDGLNVLDDGGCVEVNPVDVEVLGIENGETVKVISRRGVIRAKVKISTKTPPGVVFMTFHYAEMRTNILTHSALDPIAKIPEFKVCAVKIEPKAAAIS